jgi:tRNA G18 (ribose-2'-O)-methylase SpoU
MNVIDYYKEWEVNAIIGDLDTKRNNFTVLCSNVENDFNIATAIRNSNAFLASEVWIYGKKQYDRRGTVGTHNYTHFKHVKTIEDVHNKITELRNVHPELRIVGIDNVSGASRIDEYEWSQSHVLMIFGQEKNGIPQELLDICDDIVYIKQYGSVRSLNVGTASGIAMYDYCSKVVDND